MPDPPADLEKVGAAVKKWGLPLIGLGIGLALGDALGLGEMIAEAGKDFIKDAKMANLLAAGIYLLIGLTLWAAVPMIGPIAGGAFVGIALRTALDALGVGQ